MADVNILRLALRKVKANPESSDKEEDALEQAMQDFESAKTPTEKAAAFRAALDLARTE